ncbi:Aste57867_14016 [Aphanomyces stellatus]|uniref:Aste57867_14016 protein n=1 Tax=Aphanomyces stellatus TaxID=120398 RepID=A0A485L052_9STRA|nr:hypothetical protein As57867_013965 [Aphanomyces stellatus]VFT90846.1 Aste57867_14016 [Aphanomyces stellatus]
MNPLTKEYQRVRYMLQASLPGFRVHDDLQIWDMKNPALEAQYEQQTAGLLELDSWVAVEDLGPSMAQMYNYGFTSLDTVHAMKFTTGNIPMDAPGKKGKKQYVLCRVAAGRSLPIENEEATKHRLPPSFHSYYMVPPKTRPTYYHEYIVTNTAQVLPQFLVWFNYSAVETKAQPPCALCEKQLAAVVCRACEAELCSKCDQEVHSANKLVGRHKRTPLGSSPDADAAAFAGTPTCRLHDGKVVEFYCPVCAIPVCVHCKMVGDHSAGDKGGHRLVSLSDAYDQSVKESSKPDPLVESRKQLILTKLRQIQAREADIEANRSDVEALIRSSLAQALLRLDEEAKAKRDVLRCEELELQRQLQHMEWTDAFLASQRHVLAPIDFLAAWNQHKPLRVEQREFPVVHLPSIESVKPDLQLLGRLHVVAGDDESISHVDDHARHALAGDEIPPPATLGHVMSPKGKKIIEDVKNDLIKSSVRPLKADGSMKATTNGSNPSSLRGISVSQRNSSNANVVVRQDVWSSQLRKEMGIEDKAAVDEPASHD